MFFYDANCSRGTVRAKHNEPIVFEGINGCKTDQRLVFNDEDLHLGILLELSQFCWRQLAVDEHANVSESEKQDQHENRSGQRRNPKGEPVQEPFDWTVSGYATSVSSKASRSRRLASK